MKRAIIAGAIVLASVLNAHAGQTVYKSHDTIRPNGQKQTKAGSNANLSARMHGVAAGAVTYNRDSRDPGVGWHTENGFRVCHNDCDNPEIPGSGAVCSDVTVMGTPMRQCVTHN